MPAPNHIHPHLKAFYDTYTEVKAKDMFKRLENAAQRAEQLSVTIQPPQKPDCFLSKAESDKWQLDQQRRQKYGSTLVKRINQLSANFLNTPASGFKGNTLYQLPASGFRNDLYQHLTQLYSNKAWELFGLPKGTTKKELQDLFQQATYKHPALKAILDKKNNSSLSLTRQDLDLLQTASQRMGIIKDYLTSTPDIESLQKVEDVILESQPWLNLRQEAQYAYNTSRDNIRQLYRDATGNTKKSFSIPSQNPITTDKNNTPFM